MKTLPLNQAYQPVSNGRFKVFTPLLLSGVLLATGCATSSHKVTGNLRPPREADSVTVYHSMPAHARVIGTVSATSYHGMSLAQADADVLVNLKEEAAKLGANGVLVSNVDDKPLDGAHGGAIAIFVPPQ